MTGEREIPDDLSRVADLVLETSPVHCGTYDAKIRMLAFVFWASHFPHSVGSQGGKRRF
jgi:hypothetical protein